MKYSAATLSALATIALAQPEFLNSSYNVKEGEPFTLKFGGCEAGCTIVLQTGISTNLKDVKVLSGMSRPVSVSMSCARLFVLYLAWAWD